MHATIQAPSKFRERLAGDDLRELCPDAQLILDVGAGAGWFAKQARQVWPSATIVSFEPAQRHSQTLKKLDDRHSIIRQAVGAHSGVANLHLTYGDQSNSLLDFLPDGPLAKVHAEVGNEQVEIVTLDSLTLGKVDVLKMDVQGAELLVLEGAKELLKRDRPLIYCEVAFQELYRDHPLLEDVDAYLEEIGYRRMHLYASPMPDLWGDAIYVPEERWVEPTPVAGPVRLNIGAGETVIPGFTAIDRKLGTEAFPLPQYADNSVEEIRCVHMLEHLSYGEAQQALREWHRVLKPGGRLRISVPDIDKVVAQKADHWRFYVMGGQTDENDFHQSVYDRESLGVMLTAYGFGDVREWSSRNTDLAAADFSLNLEGFKSESASVDTNQTVKVRAAVGMPRIGWNDSWQSISDALRPFGIPIETHQGCFWSQNLHKAFERAVRDGIDWLICLDYDSMILPHHVARLMEIMGTHPEIDACAALQMRRGSETALFSNGTLLQEVDGEPVRVNTAHFGLTIIRTECLKEIPKPWLIDRPDADGCFNGDHVDADIHFWHQWRDAGKSVYVAPDVRIGHLELLVSEYDDDFQPRHYHVGKWWNLHTKQGHCMRSTQET